jgi:preprotein translocase subunit SecA
LIEHPWITNAIEKAQKRVEARNFEIRKRLLEFDDVLNLQRKNIYENRDEILLDKKIVERVINNANDIFEDIFDEYLHSLKSSNEIAFGILVKQFKEIFYMDINTPQIRNIKNPSDLFELLKKTLMNDLDNKNKVIMNLNELLRNLYLSLIDRYWQDHLENMEQLRDSVYLRTYSQKNPLVEYKIEGANMFENLIDKIRSDVINQIFKIKIETINIPEKEEALAYNHSGYSSFDHRSAANSAASGNINRQQNQNESQSSQTKVMVKSDKVGRNDPCPCGSGKKYKKCCGA